MTQTKPFDVKTMLSEIYLGEEQRIDTLRDETAYAPARSRAGDLREEVRDDGRINRRGVASGPENPPAAIQEIGLEQGNTGEVAEDSTNTLLNIRQQTHGEFHDNARVSQALKRAFRAEPGWELLHDVEKEVLDMCALKFSRILSGKSLEKQHWEDVAGYARLAEKQCG